MRAIPPRARSTHRPHTEAANELGKDLAVAARTGQDTDSFSSFFRLVPNESQSDAKNAVMPGADDDWPSGDVFRQSCAVVDFKTQRQKKQTQDC